MTREELVGEAKDMIRLCERAAAHVANHPNEGVTFSTTYRPRKANLTDILKAYLALAEPEWKDKPDCDGEWWLSVNNGSTLDLVSVDLASGTYTLHGMPYDCGKFLGEKYTKAFVPTPPKKET